MSYSYIKSVFPNFETSKVYGEGLYNTINKTPEAKKIAEQEQTKIKEPVKAFGDVGDPVKAFGEEQYVSPYTSQSKEETKENKDNLKFYNLPYNVEEHKPKPQEQNKKIIETFEDEDNHSKYILHVLECKSCKESLMKQLNILDDKIKMEGYMELASYIIFGIFILLLIDSLNKK